VLPARHSLPFIGRAGILEQLMERLRRPDDLRNSPEEFIHPGFYSLAGTGKSRLLYEVAERGKAVTPYVVRFDFDHRSGGTSPSTPRRLLFYLIDMLEEIDRVNGSFLRRLLWRWRNPFNECRRIISQLEVPSASQINIINDSQVTNLSQEINLGNIIPDNLQQAFSQALSRLCVRSRTKVLFGNYGGERQCPLILILLDSVELAPRPIRQWLPENGGLAGGKNRLHFNLMFVVAGRYRQAGVLETELPPLDAQESKALIKEYISFLLEKPQKQVRSGALLQLAGSEAAQDSLVAQGQGIPLLLQLLTDTVALRPQLEAPGDSALPTQHDACAKFVVDNYLERLREQAREQGDDHLWRHYHLLLFSAVPTRIPNSDFLGTILRDLRGTTFGRRTNYDELFEELSQEAFVEQAEDDALVLHALVRQGVQSYVEANQPKQLKEVHARAAAWFGERGDRVSSLYHRLRAEPAAAFADLRAGLADAVEGKQWSAAQNLLAATVGLPLGQVESGWVVLYKAELAWAEENRNLALERLRKLFDREGISSLGGEIASRLERWLGFDRHLDELLRQGQEVPAPRAEYLADLLWWAKQRRLPAVRAYALRRSAEEALGRGEPETARELIGESLKISRRLGDVAACADASRMVAELSLTLGPFSQAEEFFRQAIELYERTGRPAEGAGAQAGLAVALFYTGRPEDAKNLLGQALARQKELGDAAGRARTLRTLGHMGYLLHGREHYEEVEELLRESLKLFEEAGDDLGRAQVLLLLGDVALDLLRDEDARLTLSAQKIRELYVSAADLFKQKGDHLGAARAQYVLGILAGMQVYDSSMSPNAHGFDLAVIHFKQAKSLYRAARDQLSRAHTDIALGATLYTMWQKHAGALGEANEALEDALELYEKHGDVTGRAGVLFVRGQFAMWKLRYDEAGNLMREAVRLFASLGTTFGAAMQNFAELFLKMIEERSGLPDKSQLHIAFVSRSRMLDLTGWSLAARREDGRCLIIHNMERDLSRSYASPRVYSHETWHANWWV
jgi:tetratricopeptide (TPR) repeat protein